MLRRMPLSPDTLPEERVRVPQVPSENRTGPTATLSKEDDTHRKKTSLDGTARPMTCCKFE